MATVTELLTLRAGAEVVHDDAGRVTLVDGHIQSGLASFGDAAARLVTLLRTGAEEDALLEAAVSDPEDIKAMLAAHGLLSRLERGGWIERRLASGDRTLALLRPIGHELSPVAGHPPVDAPIVLSRFAYARALDGELVLETPRASVRLALLDDGAVAVLGALAAPMTPASLHLDGLDAEQTRGLLKLLWSARLVVAPADEQRQALAQWSFADLLFHERTRIGRHLGDYGGTYRLESRFPPLPPVREHPADSIALARPDLDTIVDPPLAAVLAERRSVRHHDDARALDLDALATFLYRCQRNLQTFEDGREQLLSRPYPAGGALYELELYPLIHKVVGLDPGLYHYDPEGHRLGLVAPPSPRVQLLHEYARLTAQMETGPQVLLVISARFGRVMWKYESMAYALVLKHVGVLLQTMYLVATAMGLAPCALGGGHADAFAAAIGADPYEEASVGEMILGSRPNEV